MKLLLSFWAIILLPYLSFSQGEELPIEIRTYEIFEVEKVPEFPGGEAAFKAMLYTKLYYTPELATRNIEGTAVVKFVVDPDGTLSDIKVLKDVGGAFSYALQKAFETSPKWTPGEFNRIPVSVQLTRLIPINPQVCRIIEDTDNDEAPPEIYDSPTPEPDRLTPEQRETKWQEDLKNKVFRWSEVDKEPAFPGGDDALRMYLKENFYITPEVQKQQIYGTVGCDIVVEKDGTISGITPHQPIRGGMDKVLEEVLLNSPKWTPGQIGKNAVRSKSSVYIEVKSGMPVEDPAVTGASDKVKKNTPDPLKVYEVKKVDQAPQFPGGEEALQAFITKALDYPERAANWHTKLPALYEFVVEADGSITWLRMIKDPGYSQGRKGIDIINKMPKWTPGTKNGVPVRVNYVLPIEFRLQ